MFWTVNSQKYITTMWGDINFNTILIWAVHISWSLAQSIYKTTDLWLTRTPIFINALINAVNGIAADQTWTKIVVVWNHISWGVDHWHVYISNNSWSTWTDITSNFSPFNGVIQNVVMSDDGQVIVIISQTASDTFGEGIVMSIDGWTSRLDKWIHWSLASRSLACSADWSKILYANRNYSNQWLYLSTNTWVSFTEITPSWVTGQDYISCNISWDWSIIFAVCYTTSIMWLSINSWSTRTNIGTSSLWFWNCISRDWNILRYNDKTSEDNFATYLIDEHTIPTEAIINNDWTIIANYSLDFYISWPFVPAKLSWRFNFFKK